MILVASTLLPMITYDFNGRYLSSVVILGAGFLYGAVRLQREPSRKAALQLYLYSLLYLALVFGAMVCDQPRKLLASESSSPSMSACVKPPS